MNITLIVIGFYLLVWTRVCFKNNNIQWLSTSIILWLAFTLTARQLLPTIYYIGSAFSIYHVYFFLFLGSLPWCYNHLRFNPKNKQISSNQIGCLQPAFILSNIILHLSLLSISLIVWFWYPQHLKLTFLFSFFEQYFLLPIWIIGLHFTLTSLLWMVGKFNKQSSLSVSSVLLLMLVCMTGFAFVAYAVVDILGR